MDREDCWHHDHRHGVSPALQTHGETLGCTTQPSRWWTPQQTDQHVLTRVTCGQRGGQRTHLTVLPHDVHFDGALCRNIKFCACGGVGQSTAMSAARGGGGAALNPKGQVFSFYRKQATNCSDFLKHRALAHQVPSQHKRRYDLWYHLFLHASNKRGKNKSNKWRERERVEDAASAWHLGPGVWVFRYGEGRCL